MARPNGAILGATVVASRAGEMITEISVAMRHSLTVSDLASTLHVYPSWSLAVQQLASNASVGRFVTSGFGKLALRVAGLRR